MATRSNCTNARTANCAPAGAQFAVRALVQFERVAIEPGQTKNLTLHVEPRRLQFWSTAKQRWETAVGARKVEIGGSSRDVRLQAETIIAP